MARLKTRPLAGLMVVAATSVGMVGLGLPTATVVTASASPPAVAQAWFRDPVSAAAARRHEIRVPADPGGYTGGIRQTAATFRTHSGSLDVPVGWASGRTVVAPEALALTNTGSSPSTARHSPPPPSSRSASYGPRWLASAGCAARGTPISAAPPPISRPSAWSEPRQCEPWSNGTIPA